ncbi:MAG: hypothetical protein AB1453_04440 [Chloroflexota bacterium]
MTPTGKKPAGSTAGGTQTGGKPFRTYFNTSGKPAASLRGGRLVKSVRGSRHMLRQPPGWAVDCTILNAARLDGATSVEIRDVETNRIYTAPVSLFDQHGVTLDRGFGRQIALPLAYWSMRDER